MIASPGGGAVKSVHHYRLAEPRAEAGSAPHSRLQRPRLDAASASLALVGLLILAGGMSACGGSPIRARPEGTSSLWEVRHQARHFLPEPGPREVVVVVNYNSPVGNHAGLWAGDLLADPAGSYLAVRQRAPAWSGPNLTDYLRYQMEDGDRVFSYRFTLDDTAFAALRQRVLDAGPTAPLFCAAAVQNLSAGIGPFQVIPQVTWASPAELAEHLAPLWKLPGAAGTCQWPDGAAC